MPKKKANKKVDDDWENDVEEMEAETNQVWNLLFEVLTWLCFWQEAPEVSAKAAPAAETVDDIDDMWSDDDKKKKGKKGKKGKGQEAQEDQAPTPGFIPCRQLNSLPFHVQNLLLKAQP